MALYIPPHFACDDPAIARQVAQAYPFATLISTDGGEPWITQAPVLWEDGSFLMAHISRANPHARLIEQGCPIIIVFNGPHAYVSPSMYVTANQVPTWNYATVHVHGTPEVLSGSETLTELERLVQGFDPDWTVDPAHAERQSLGVVAFRVRIERLEIKLKMSQNKPLEDRLGVVEGLRSRGDVQSREVADWVAKLQE